MLTGHSDTGREKEALDMNCILSMRLGETFLQSETDIKLKNILCECSCSLTCYSCMVDGMLWYNDSNMIWYETQFPQNFSYFLHFFQFSPVAGQTGVTIVTLICVRLHTISFIFYTHTACTNLDCIQIAFHRERWT